jgi:hypothetical protein
MKENLREELNIMLGRLNALHSVVHTLVRTLGQPPEALHAALSEAQLRVEADSVALPVAEAHLQEFHRVLAEMCEAARLRTLD